MNHSPRKFTVSGEPLGYYAMGKTPNWERKRRYHAWCLRVRVAALQAGIALPLVATKGRPLWLKTLAFFRDGRHCDPENTHKGVKDALFYSGAVKIRNAGALTISNGKSRKKPKGGDKYTGGAYAPPLYDPQNPRVEIEIKPAPPAGGKET